MKLSEDAFLDALHKNMALVARPSLSDRLVEDLALDSLARLELWVAFEVLAQRPIDPAALEACHTVGELYSFARQLLSGRQA